MLFLLIFIILFRNAYAYNSFTVKPFFQYSPQISSIPQLVLIAGCTGTGKSSFGMSLALGRGILRCISTDSIRQVMRTLDKSPELHRSSYSGTGDPILNWLESSEVIKESLVSVVNDALARQVSLVVEGVHIVPSSEMINNWRSKGGSALGILMTIKNEDHHRDWLYKRGEMTGKGAEKQLKAFDRIRKIQDEMIRLAKENSWLIIEQRIEPDPIDIVTNLLDQSQLVAKNTQPIESLDSHSEI